MPAVNAHNGKINPCSEQLSAQTKEIKCVRLEQLHTASMEVLNIEES